MIFWVDRVEERLDDTFGLISQSLGDGRVGGIGFLVEPSAELVAVLLRGEDDQTEEDELLGRVGPVHEVLFREQRG